MDNINSISRYCAVHALPYDFWHYDDSIGVYKMDMDFLVLKVDTLGTLEYSNPEMFFMDINNPAHHIRPSVASSLFLFLHRN